MAKCVGICEGLPTKHSNCMPWCGITAYYCSTCVKRIGIKDAVKSAKGRATCPCCREQLRTRSKSRAKWMRFAA